jgi:hypothetical protein
MAATLKEELMGQVILPPHAEQLVHDMECAIVSLPTEATGSASLDRTTPDGVTVVPGVPEPPD